MAKPLNLKDFDQKPDDAMVPEKEGDAMLAISEWTRRRKRPLPRYEVAPGIFRNRVGDIRALARGKTSAV